MKTKPILFNERMVRAILEGRKKQTRRPIKRRYDNTALEMKTDKYGTRLIEIQKDEEGVTFGKHEDGSTWRKLRAYIEPKPAYKAGDILYVREAWQYVYETEYDRECGKENNYCRNIRTLIANWDDVPKTLINEKSQNESCDGMAPRPQYAVFRASDIRYTDPENKLLWRPSIHMPKEAARIWLRVARVGIEHLREITEESAIMEGFQADENFTARERFAMTWNSAYGVAGKHDPVNWASDPWVWVYSFERCEKP